MDDRNLDNRFVNTEQVQTGINIQSLLYKKDTLDVNMYLYIIFDKNSQLIANSSWDRKNSAILFVVWSSHLSCSVSF